MNDKSEQINTAIQYVRVDEDSMRPCNEFVLWCNKIANKLIKDGFITESVYADPKNIHMALFYSIHHTWDEAADEMKEWGWQRLKKEFKLWV